MQYSLVGHGYQTHCVLQENLTDLLERCAKLFEQAERYELLGEIYRLIVPIYEQRRDFVKLADAYLLLHKAYSAVVEAQTSGRRLLGNYFKVAFYGAVSALLCDGCSSCQLIGRFCRGRYCTFVMS